MIKPTKKKTAPKKRAAAKPRKTVAPAARAHNDRVAAELALEASITRAIRLFERTAGYVVLRVSLYRTLQPVRSGLDVQVVTQQR